MEDERHPDAPITMTHARLRASQGDLETARRVLRAILDAEPDHTEARELLVALGETPDEPSLPSAEVGEPEPEAATAESLAGRFRSTLGRGDERPERLRRWLDTIRSHRGPRRHVG